MSCDVDDYNALRSILEETEEVKNGLRAKLAAVEAFAAERDEMLRTLYRRYILNGQTYDEWYDNVRKLAEEWVEP